jgi:hypothetical protein
VLTRAMPVRRPGMRRQLRQCEAVSRIGPRRRRRERTEAEARLRERRGRAPGNHRVPDARRCRVVAVGRCAFGATDRPVRDPIRFARRVGARRDHRPARLALTRTAGAVDRAFVDWHHARRSRRHGRARRGARRCARGGRRSSRLLEGYLPYNYGRADAERIRAAAIPFLRELEASPPRVPASVTHARPQLVSVRAEAATGGSDIVVVAEVEDGRRRYRIPLAVRNTAGRWLVTAVSG